MRWKGVIRDAMIEGQFLPLAFPVIADNNGRGVWEALDWKVLKEAKNAVTQYGLKSPYTQSVLQHIFSSQLLTPYDSRMIVQMLLPASQQLQFLQHWQTACDRAASIPRQQGDPLFGVQAQMLVGAGPFTRPEWQAQCATEVLQLSQELAYRALTNMHDENTRPAFTAVKQGPTESYGKFIDRLHAAIMAHPDMDESMKAKFLDMLAFDNANEKTKRALSVLLRGSNTGQLLEAAERMSEQEKATIMAAAVGAAVKPLISRNQGGKRDKKCFNCGKLGHVRKECRSLISTEGRGNKWCTNCKKGTRDTRECRRSGNKAQSAPHPRVTTQVQGAWTAAPPPRSAAPAWTGRQQ